MNWRKILTIGSMPLVQHLIPNNKGRAKMGKQVNDKPESQEERISMLWDAVFNHIPSQFAWLNLKLTFVLTFIALILALVAILVVR